jgi:hypothetical protein
VYSEQETPKRRTALVTPLTCIIERRALKEKLEGSGSWCSRDHPKVLGFFAVPVKVRGMGSFPVRAFAIE